MKWKWNRKKKRKKERKKERKEEKTRSSKRIDEKVNACWQNNVSPLDLFHVTTVTDNLSFITRSNTLCSPGDPPMKWYWMEHLTKRPTMCNYAPTMTQFCSILHLNRVPPLSLSISFSLSLFFANTPTNVSSSHPLKLQCCKGVFVPDGNKQGTVWKLKRYFQGF